MVPTLKGLIVNTVIPWKIYHWMVIKTSASFVNLKKYVNKYLALFYLTLNRRCLGLLIFCIFQLILFLFDI